MLKADAKAYFDNNVSELMRQLGRSRLLFYTWKGNRVPDKYAKQIERITDGQLKADVNRRQCREVRVNREVVS